MGAYNRLCGRSASASKFLLRDQLHHKWGFKGDEVVQLCLTDCQAPVQVPIRELVGFRRVDLKPGEAQKVSFTVDPRELSLITSDTRRVIEPGIFDISVRGKQPGFSGDADASTTKVLTGHFTVTGSTVELEL
jgi:beta-glucosidase